MKSWSLLETQKEKMMERMQIKFFDYWMFCRFPILCPEDEFEEFPLIVVGDSSTTAAILVMK